jgi:hypothetical protein
MIEKNTTNDDYCGYSDNYYNIIIPLTGKSKETRKAEGANKQ